MPWCPKCGGEYREGFTFCVGCQCKLTDEPPPKPEPEQEPDLFLPPPVLREPVLLGAIDDSLECDMLVQLLKSSGIPVLLRPSLCAGYTRQFYGHSLFGSDLYVEREDADAARIIAGDFSSCRLAGEPPAEPQGLEGLENPAPWERFRRVYRWIARFSVILILYTLLNQFFNLLRN